MFLQSLIVFFHVTKNVIFEWAWFNCRVQHEGESAEQYIATLYNLVNMNSELIRDRLVVGICDMGLSERLQADEKLMLDKAKKAIRIKEAVTNSRSSFKEIQRGIP